MSITQTTMKRRPWWMTTPTLISLLVLAITTLAVLVGPVVLSAGDTIDSVNRLLAPSWSHPFGTDELGRDLLLRNLNAGRLTMAIAAGAMVLSVIVGVAWGMIAAAGKGWVDEVLMRLSDAVLAVPMILFGLVAIAAFGSSVPVLIVVLGVIKAPLTARVVRAATLTELATDYVRGLRMVGVSRIRILFREVLPNVTPTIIAQSTLNLATAIIVEASLSFMGLGIQPPEATWGTLLKLGYNNLFQSSTYALFPALLTLILVAALNVLGQELQKTLDRRSA